MAHYKILGQDPYWMNFYGLMILTLIEVLAVGADLDSFAESVGPRRRSSHCGYSPSSRSRSSS